MALKGQNTKYTEDTPRLLLEHFQVEDYTYYDKEVYTAKDGVAKIMEREACDYPTLAGFARKMGVHSGTINDWMARHPAFAEAVHKCKQIQEDLIIKHGLKGNYNSSFAKFMMINTMKYKEKLETENTNREIKIEIDSDDAKL